MFRLDDQNVYHAEFLDQFDWLRHGFGTRLSNGWPDRSRLVTPKQVHSNRVLVVPPNAPTGEDARLGEGDALANAEAGLIAGIRTADCLPILLVDEATRKVGAIHAGWRGSVSGISTELLRVMRELYGTRPEDVWVAIGPGIGPCCFEVGPDVAVQFQSYFPERADLNHRTKLDLVETNRRQLTSAGVPAGQIESSGLCTFCRSDQFHSYRRDGPPAGRMISGIGVREGRKELGERSLSRSRPCKLL